jgi:hypothetical protein
MYNKILHKCGLAGYRPRRRFSWWPPAKRGNGARQGEGDESSPEMAGEGEGQSGAVWVAFAGGEGLLKVPLSP